jgi:hypothetical protein
MVPSPLLVGPPRPPLRLALPQSLVNGRISDDVVYQVDNQKLPLSSVN